MLEEYHPHAFHADAKYIDYEGYLLSDTVSDPIDPKLLVSDVSDPIDPIVSSHEKKVPTPPAPEPLRSELTQVKQINISADSKTKDIDPESDPENTDEAEAENEEEERDNDQDATADEDEEREDDKDAAADEDEEREDAAADEDEERDDDQGTTEPKADAESRAKAKAETEKPDIRAEQKGDLELKRIVQNYGVHDEPLATVMNILIAMDRFEQKMIGHPDGWDLIAVEKLLLRYYPSWKGDLHAFLQNPKHSELVKIRYRRLGGINVSIHSKWKPSNHI
jgi:hypothetical protein